MCWTVILYQMSIRRILCQTLAHISLMPLLDPLSCSNLTTMYIRCYELKGLEIHQMCATMLIPKINCVVVFMKEHYQTCNTTP